MMPSSKEWKKLVLVFVIVFAAVAVMAKVTEASDPVDTFFRAGTPSGSVGIGMNLQEFEGSTNNGPGMAWGFVSLKYKTEAFYGFRAGGWWIGVHDLWENHDGDYETVYTQNSDIRNFYALYQPPSTKTVLTVGRADFVKNPSMDGDAHQGLQLVVDDIPRASLKLAAVNRWTKHSTTDFDADGILGWADVSSGDDFATENPDAGDVFYAGTLSYRVVDPVSLAIYSDYQADVMLVYGATFDSSVPVSDSLKWGVDAIFARYNNKTPKSVADYDNVNEWLVHTSLGGDVFSLGLGWFAVGNSALDTTAGIFNNFDPLENDDLDTAGPGNDVNLYYIDSTITLDPVKLSLAYGRTDNQSVDSNSDEIDVFFTVDITESTKLEGYITWMSFSSDAYDNYFKGGTTLSYYF